VPPQDLDRLPGAEIVLPGIADLEAGRETVNALAVRLAAPVQGMREQADAERIRRGYWSC
jgi:hypothetical protein